MCCGDHKPCSLGKVKQTKQLSIKRIYREISGSTTETNVRQVCFIFNSNAVRVITDTTGEFWFCGKDVCTIC